uniref:CSD domain-containing protein n=1 Tax=Eutreptiella gymnastica TaxID=73025 RepID=A0A7S4CQR7_9EUGL
MSYRDSKRPRYAEPRSRERGGITDTLSALISSNPDVLRAVQMLASALGGSGREDRDYRDRGRGSKRPREARRSVGKVTAFNDKGFGFISCGDVEPEVFVHQSETLRALHPGETVEFELIADGPGRWKAIDVVATDSSKYRPATRPSQYTGRVIDWKEQGFGFIASPGFDRDVFVHAHNLVGITSLRSNDEVEFAVEVDENNRYNALDVRLYQKRHSTRDVPDVRDSRDMPPPAAVDGEVLGGVISTYKPTQGFGFVKCNSLGADAFVHIKSVIEPKGVESLAEGENVEFRVQVNSKGQYDAVNVVLLDRRERQTYVGVVTMYNIGKGKGKGKGGSGYGFIKCDDFGREVFMHHSELKGGGIPECGDEVQFEVELDDTHRYNAKNINIIGKGSGRISE